MKLPLITSTLFLTLTGAHAAITALDVQLSRSNDARTDSSLGIITPTTFNTGNPGPASQTITYTITGLTLDSVGTGDDEVTITMGLAATSSTAAVTGIGASFGAWGVEDGTGSASLVESDETLSFSITAASVTLGAGAFETANITFDGFDGFAALNAADGETFNISNTVASDVTGIDAADLTTPYPEPAAHRYDLISTEQSFTIEGGNGGMRYGYITGSFTVETIPEPSAAALLGLGALGLTLRRRR